MSTPESTPSPATPPPETPVDLATWLERFCEHADNMFRSDERFIMLRAAADELRRLKARSAESVKDFLLIQAYCKGAKWHLIDTAAHIGRQKIEQLSPHFPASPEQSSDLGAGAASSQPATAEVDKIAPPGKSSVDLATWVRGIASMFSVMGIELDRDFKANLEAVAAKLSPKGDDENDRQNTGGRPNASPAQSVDQPAPDVPAQTQGAGVFFPSRNDLAEEFIGMGWHPTGDAQWEHIDGWRTRLNADITRAVESATKELRQQKTNWESAAHYNEAERASAATAVIQLRQHVTAQAAQIAELREQANNWESLAHQNEKERASASAAVIALTRERDALKAEFHRLSLGKDAAAVLDSWTKNYGIQKDPALGYLQAGIQSAVENSREGSISNEYEFTRVGEVVFFGIPSMVNERGVKHGLSRSTALRLLGELRVALNFPGEAEADARATKAESDLAALRLLVEKNAKIELLLIAVARAAWQLCDNTEEDGEHLMTCDATDFNVLSETLDVLDLLPNPDGEAATGPRKAEYQLALAPDSCAKEVRPNYQANDMALLQGELAKYRERLAWLGNPVNKFVFSVMADGQIKVFVGRSDFKFFPTMEVAIDDAARAAKEEVK